MELFGVREHAQDDIACKTGAKERLVRLARALKHDVVLRKTLPDNQELFYWKHKT
jgi:hypothetical protein